jgi:AraC-like DNA-binding protein
LTFFGSDLTLPRIEPPAAAYLIWIKKMDMQTTRSRQMNVHVAGNGSVRVGTLQPLAEILLGMGVDPTKLLAECGVDPKVFENPENRIPLTLHNRLVALAVVRTRCPHLGLLVGQRDGLQSIGLAGLLARYSEDVESAVRSFVRYLHTHVRGAKSSLDVDGDVATLTWEIYQPGVEAVDQVGDGALAVIFNMMLEICGPEWRPIEVRFAHREPAQLQPFQLFFRTTLCFDVEDYSLRFASSWLPRPVKQADPMLRRVLQKEIDAIEARHEADFPEQVRSVLRSALLTGHARSDKLAALFSMHSSTLARRLKPYGVGFRELVDECRYEVAREMLGYSALDVSQIAEMLDYAEASAFTRAFKRWSGTTPARWRAQHE